MIAKERVKQVQWFLKFLDADLDALPYSEKNKLVTDTLNILMGISSLLFGDGSADNLLPAGRFDEFKAIDRLGHEWMQGQQLKACQERLRKFFDGVSEQLKRSKKYAEEGWTSKTDFENFFSLGQVESALRMRIETRMIPWEVKLKNKGKKNEKVLRRLVPGAFENTALNLSFKASSDEDTLLFYFLKALEGFPLGAIRQCPECSRWFVHTSKKEKIYCQNKCAARVASRARRERLKKEDKETYRLELEANKQRALKSYDRKITKRLGKHVSRTPRKK
jgi:hypothetical protein